MAATIRKSQKQGEPGAPRPIRIRHHGGYRGNMLMLRLGSLFLPLGYAAVAAAAAWFWLAERPARAASEDFLERIFGRQSRLRRGWQSYRHMNMYGKMLLDRSVFLAGLDRRFLVDSLDEPNIRDALRRRRGLLILTGHFGCAEISAPLLQQLDPGRPLHFVRYANPRDATEQFQRDQWKKLAAARWINSFDPLAAGVEIMAALQRGECVAMQADRAMRGRTIPATLLGRRVDLPAGPFTAAVVGEAVVVCAFTFRAGYRRYRTCISPPRCYVPSSGVSKEAAIAQAAGDYARELEKLLKLHPYQWGNFYRFWDGAPAVGQSPESSNSSTQAGAPAT